MIPDFMLQLIAEEIHAHEALRGVPIGYHGTSECRMIHNGDATSPHHSDVIVIIEELGSPMPVHGQPGQQSCRRRSGSAGPAPRVLSAPPPAIENGSRVWSELAGAGLSCGVAVASGYTMIGGAVGAVPTGGASTVLIVAGWFGFATSSIACVNGIVRSTEAIRNPDDNSLQQWDSDPVYATVFLINDIVGISTGVVAAPSAVRGVIRLLRTRGSLPTAQALRSMNRFQRRDAMSRALRQASRDPDDAAQMAEALRNAGYQESQISRLIGDGVVTRSMARSGGGAVVQQTNRVLSERTARLLNSALRDIIVAATGFTGSALPSAITGSASGSVNALIVHVMRRQ